MNEECNKAIERRLVAEALNKGNMAVLDEYLAPDFIYHGPGGNEVKGIEEDKRFLTMLRTIYPDLHVTIEEILADGDLAATRTTSTFTAINNAGNIPPTGRKISLSGTIIDRFKDGKLAETWEYYDRLDLYQQLGLLPVKKPDKTK